MIINTADGYLHGVDRANYRLLWSTSSGKPMLGTTTSNLDYVTDGSKLNSEIESEQDKIQNRVVETIIPSIDGNVLIHTGKAMDFSSNDEDDSVFIQSDTMRKTSVTARVLTENAPFISQDGVLFTGQKTTSILGLGLDMQTGDLISSTADNGERVKQSLPSENNSNNFINRNEIVTRGDDAPVSEISRPSSSSSQSSSSGSSNSERSSGTLWFGRVDYGLRATNLNSGQRYFDMTYGEWHPMVSSASLPALPDGRSAIKAPSEAFSIVSTPLGEMFLADEASGEVLIKRGSLDLKSPVISAFSVKQRRGSSGLHSSAREQPFSVTSLKVRHRAPYLPTASVDLTALPKAVMDESFSPEDGMRSKDVIAEVSEAGSVLIVQSSQGIHSDGMLYAIEVPTAAPLQALEEQEEGTDRKSINSGTLFSLPPSENWQRHADSDGMKKTEAASISINPDSSLDSSEGSSLASVTELNKLLISRTSSLPAVKSSLLLKNDRQNVPLSARSPLLTAQSSAKDAGQSEQSLDLIPMLTELTSQSDDDLIAELMDDNSYFEDDDYIGGHSLSPFPSPGPGLLPQDSETLAALPDPSSASSLTLKQGRYRIHADPYNGGLFTPIQQVLIENIRLTKHLNQLQAEIENSRVPLSRTDNGYDDSDYFSSFRSDYDASDHGNNPRAFAEAFSAKEIFKNVLKATQFVQVFFFSLLMLFLAGILLLIIGRAVMRMSTTYSLFLSKYPRLQQFIAVIEKPFVLILHFLQVESLIAIANSTEKGDSLTSPSRLSSKSRSDSVSLLVEYDENGKKVTKVGSLAMFETVLGYGSHGTVVFKGSLNGRPVAIKRMLSQFNKAADRYHKYIQLFQLVFNFIIYQKLKTNF